MGTTRCRILTLYNLWGTIMSVLKYTLSVSTVYSVGYHYHAVQIHFLLGTTRQIVLSMVLDTILEYTINIGISIQQLECKEYDRRQKKIEIYIYWQKLLLRFKIKNFVIKAVTIHITESDHYYFWMMTTCDQNFSLSYWFKSLIFMTD